MEHDAELPERQAAELASPGRPEQEASSGGRTTDARGSGRWLRVGVSALVVTVLVAAIVLFSSVNVLAAVGAVLFGLVIMRVGWFFLAQFATPPPPPPDPGTLRRVRLTYRCPSCSAEVRMTAAPSEDPEPPRHCMEEMELISSQE